MSNKNKKIIKKIEHIEKNVNISNENFKRKNFVNKKFNKNFRNSNQYKKKFKYNPKVKKNNIQNKKVAS